HTLWDHCFELPHKHLEAEQTIVDSVAVGKATHKLKFGENGKLEIFDWPGEYAQRFDGVDKGGGDRPADLQKIYEDNKRTAIIRIQQDDAARPDGQGARSRRHIAAHHKLTSTPLPGHPRFKAHNPDGDYVLTHVTHAAPLVGRVGD